ncbi:hypothetical protein LXA43DRAFT_896729, partial [Ganoderma leucocontextum]
KTCLFVSKPHYDIAIRSLFSHVHITFGAWCPNGRRSTSAHDIQDYAEEQREATKRRNARIRGEILQHIRRTPRFTTIIKQMSVLAYAAGEPSELSELGCLEEALTMLRSLRGFAWYGSNPPPPPSIIERLREASSHSNALVDSMRPGPLPRLTSLAFLQRHHPRRPITEDSTAAAMTSIRALITTNATTLRSLCVYGDILLDLDVSSFKHLTELSIVNPRTLPNFTAIFEQCTAIRSFTLCDKARYDDQEDVTYEHWSNDEFTDVVRAHPGAFPHLTSLKLMGAWFWADQMEAVAAFLRDKASLRRLDLMNDKWTRWDGDGIVDDWCPLLEILSGFAHLEVLGFDMRGAHLTADDMRCLERYIPRWVTALLVTVFAESSKAQVEDWRRLITGLDSLRYLHILSVYGQERPAIEDILSSSPLPSLELFGYNQNMHWVSSKDSDAGAVELGERWPYPRVQFRTRDDFGCEDWEWLLRHHGEDNEDVFCEWGSFLLQPLLTPHDGRDMGEVEDPRWSGLVSHPGPRHANLVSV